MVATRVLAGIVVGGAVATAAIVAPAFGAVDQPVRVARHVPAAPVASLGGFTPAAADPRLAALFSRGGLDVTDFRFTPVESQRNSRAVTVAVRTRTNRAPANAGPARLIANTAEPNVGLAPIAYNLGVGVGWKRFTIVGDLNHVDLAGRPGSRDGADVSVSYSTRRITGRVKAAADRPIAGASYMVEEAPSYSVDVGGSYSLTHNLDVTAGLRYRSDRERLARTDDSRRDSQAFYVGTAFRF